MSAEQMSFDDDPMIDAYNDDLAKLDKEVRQITKEMNALVYEQKKLNKNVNNRRMTRSEH